MKKNIIWVLCIGAVLLIAVIFTLNNNEKHVEEIVESPLFTNGVIHEITYEKGKTTLADYQFEVNGISFTSSKGDGRLQHLGKLIIDRPFPIIYNSEDPNKNDILIFKSDFLKYNIKFSDSLNWVLELEQK